MLVVNVLMYRTHSDQPYYFIIHAEWNVQRSFWWRACFWVRNILNVFIVFEIKVIYKYFGFIFNAPWGKTVIFKRIYDEIRKAFAVLDHPFEKYSTFFFIIKSNGKLVSIHELIYACINKRT